MLYASMRRLPNTYRKSSALFFRTNGYLIKLEKQQHMAILCNHMRLEILKPDETKLHHFWLLSRDCNIKKDTRVSRVKQKGASMLSYLLKSAVKVIRPHSFRPEFGRPLLW